MEKSLTSVSVLASQFFYLQKTNFSHLNRSSRKKKFKFPCSKSTIWLLVRKYNIISFVVLCYKHRYIENSLSNNFFVLSFDSKASRAFQKKSKQLLQPWGLNYMILALDESTKIFFGQIHSFSLFHCSSFHIFYLHHMGWDVG